MLEFQNVKPAAIWQDCVPVALVIAAWFSYIRCIKDAFASNRKLCIIFKLPVL